MSGDFAPWSNEMTVGSMAVIAEGERKAISKRTTEALAAAKVRLVNLTETTTDARASTDGASLTSKLHPPDSLAAFKRQP